MNKQKLLTWILFLLIFFFIAQFFSKKTTPPPELVSTPLGVQTLKNEYASGEEVVLTVRNNTDAAIALPATCPKNPFRVLIWKGEKFEEKTAETKIDCDELAPAVTLNPNEEKKVSYTYWNYTLFGEPGRYKVEVILPGELGTASGTTTNVFSSNEFAVVEAGFWRSLFRSVFYQPLYNVLVFFIRIAPFRDLGFAIIMLTLLIRLILLVPSQRALVSQRRMQELQPKLEHIKKEFAGNQQRIGEETMKLWKEHKVNPFGSCLPLLIQFPVLIALFYVIQNGLNPDNTHLLYAPLKNTDLTDLHTNFLGILELTKVNVFVLPLIIGVLQFAQLKLAAAKKKRHEDKEGKPAPKSEMEMANKTMTYIMPVMIAIFTASVPAGVGLYWGISTLFGIGQQLIVNKSK